MKIESSVIIPNWNGADLLKICLPSLKKQTYQNFELIIIDNGSTDDSLAVIKSLYPQAKVIKNNKNIGFSPAVNLGIKKAVGKYIILINNDTKLDKSALKYLVQAAKDHPEVGMVAAKMLNFYNPKIIDSAGCFISSVGHANGIGYGEEDSSKFKIARYVFLVSGGGCLIKRAVFEEIGFFDDDYFAYFEDVDLCLRAQMVGFKGWFEPKAKIYHIHKATSSKNRAFLEYLQFRNMTQTIIKDFPSKLLLKDWNIIKIILVNLNTILFLAKQGYFWSALKAEIYILLNLFKLLKKRQQIQSQIKVDANYLVSNFYPKQVSFYGLLKPGVGRV